MANNGNNIDLGSFSWDISAIEKQVIENRKQLEGYSTALKYNKDILKQQSKEITDNAKTLLLCKEMQKELNQALQNGTISEQDYLEAMDEVNKEMDETKKRTDEIIASQTELIKTNLEVEKSIRALQEENRNLNTLMAAGRTEAGDNSTAYKDLNKELNALKLEAKNLGAELVMMEQNGDTTSEAYLALKKRWEEASKAANDLNDRFKEIDGAIGDNQRSVGDYRNAIKDAFGDMSDSFDALLSGNIKEGLTGLKDSFTSLKDTAKELYTTLAANPWLAIVAAIALYVQAVIEHNAYISEANAKVEELAGTTGELTNELRRAGEAISETFENKDFEDAITEMDSLMDDFKISSQEAWDTYVAGLVKGGAANDEFGDSIKEYGALLAQSGYSAQQFIAILNTGINLGIYSDKLPDAIKEAGLALNEQTKATRDALINAFGASFSDDLLKRVQQGRTTVAQALDEIADKAETTNLNQQQQAQLTADLFKGAGEDAGGSIVIFEALNKAQKETNENLTDLQKQTKLLADLNLEVQKAKDEAFASESVRGFRKELDITWKSIQIGWYKALGVVTQVLQDSGNGFQLLIRNTVDSFKAIPAGFREVSKSVGSDLAKLGQIGSTAGDIIKKAFSLDPEGAKASYNDLKNQIKNFNSDTLASLSKVDDYLANINAKNVAAIKAQNAAKAEAQRLEDEAEAKRNAANGKTTGATGDAEAKAAADAKKKADAEAKKAETKRLADLKKAQADAKKEADDLAKRDLETKRNNAQAAADIAKGELADYIRNNAEKFKDDKKLTDQKLKDQLAYFDTLAKKQKAQNKLEEDSKKLAIQQKIDELEKKKELNKVELDEVASLKMSISILTRDTAAADAEVEQQVADKKKEINEKFYNDLLEQQRLHRAIAYQQRILDLEIQGGQETEILLTQEDERFQDLLDKFAEQNKIKLDFDEDRYITEQEIQMARDELQAQYDASKDERERLRVQNQLDALDFMAAQSAENIRKIQENAERAKLEAISNTFGQAKTLFKENTLAYKAMAIAEATISTYLSVTKTLAEYPGPVGWAMSAVQIALGLANVAKIVGVKGFSSGGYTGDGGVFEPAGVVHKGEVVWSQADVAAVGGAAVADAMRPTYGGYFNGGAVGISSIPSVQSAIMGNNVTVMLDENSVSLIADATYAGSQRGIGDMADNTDIRLGANFG